MKSCFNFNFQFLSISASKTCNSTDIDSDREDQSSQRLIFEGFQIRIRLNEIDTVLFTDL